MRILLTNDDGIDSPGLHALESAFSTRDSAEIWTVAPDRERSGQSHAITIMEPVRTRRLGERRFSASGTPADCVVVGAASLMPEPPDVVISGINRGPNLGTDILYSGTVAGARQASLLSLPGIAISLAAFRGTLHWSAAAQWLVERVDRLLEKWTDSFFYNLNFPNLPEHREKAEWTVPSRRHYRDGYRVMDAINGDRFHFLTETEVETEEQDGGDWHAVQRGRVSCSAIHLHPTVDPLQQELAELDV